MSLRYILGGAGTGKTGFCHDSMIKSGESNVILIVPEQFSLETEKALTQKAPQGAIMRIQVLSFLRLAYNIFSRFGTKPGKNMDNTSKSMLVRKVISECKSELRYFKNTNITTGFIEKTCDLIKEFHQYGLEPGQIDIPEGALGLKMRDISLIYERYTDYIKDNYITNDEILDLLADNWVEEALGKDAVIWLDNFTGFTPQEYKVVAKLLKYAKEVNICLTIKSSETYYKDLKINDIFYETKKTVNKLTDLAKELGTSVWETVFLRENFRLKDSPELDYLERNLFSYSAKKFPSENERIKICSAQNRFDEAELVASKIVELVRDKGFRYMDIGVLCGDIKAYENIMENSFSRYGIPLFIDSRMDVLSHPFTELSRALVEIVARNWSYESVFRFLKTGLTPVSDRDIDLLENYSLAYGITGIKWRLKEWKYGFYKNSPYDKEEIHRLKDEVCACVDLFAKGLTAQSNITVADFAERMYRMAEGLSIKEKLSLMYMEAQESGDGILMRRHLGSWNIIANIFDKMAEVFGGAKMKAATIFEMFEAGILNSDLGLIPPIKDKVIFGDVYRSRLDEIKALFVMGAVDKEFPRVRKNDGLLNDNDRETLKEKGLTLAPSSLHAMALDNFHIYSTMAKACERLTFTYPQADLEGKSFYRSSIITKIEKLFANTTEPPPEISMPRPMFEKAAREIGRFAVTGEMGESYQSLIGWYENQEEYKESVRVIKEIAFGAEIPRLNPEHDIYDEEIKTNVSRLEKYVECPFGFFARYNLGLAERESFKIMGMDMGNLFHDVMEEFSKEMTARGSSWDSLDEEIISDCTKIAFEKAVGNIKSDVFINDARSKYVLDRALRIAKKSIWALSSQLKKGSFRPYSQELDFGIKNPSTSIEIDINEKHKFALSGRIDRVDIYEKDDQAYVNIIDYKTGNVNFDFTDVYYGMQLQLVLYMESLLKNSVEILEDKPPASPGGLFYFKIKDPVLEYEEGIEEILPESILKEYKMSGILVNDKKIVEAVEDSDNLSVISARKNKDGEYTSRSGTLVDYDSFVRLMEYSVNKVKEIGQNMVDGKIAPFPYKKGARTGCDFCPYSGICRFDPKSGKYNGFSKKKSISDFS